MQNFPKNVSSKDEKIYHLKMVFQENFLRLTVAVGLQKRSSSKVKL